jgi:hypothetical protein
MAIAKLSIDLEARLGQFENEIRRISSLSEQMSNRIQGSFSGVSAVFSGLAAAFGGSAAISTFRSTVDSLDKIDEAAERISISVESLSALNFSGKMSGLADGDIEMALTKLSVKMQEAASGSKEAAALFSDLGVKVTDSSGQLKKADVVFSEVAERFSKLEDGAGKTALAVDTFGRSGAGLVPLLNRGAEGLEKMRREAELLGGIIDGKLTQKASDFNDNLDRLSLLSAAAGRAIASEMLPALNEAAQSFIIAQKHSKGFLDSLSLKMPGLQMVDAASELRSVMSDLEQVDFRLSNGRSKDEAADKKLLADLERRAGYYRELVNLKDRVDGLPQVSEGGKEKIKRAPTGGGKVRAVAAERVASFTDYDSQITQRIATAIDKTDVVKAAELARQLEKIDQLAAAGLDPAIVQAVRDDLSGAAKAAADELARLNKLLGETPTAKLEAVRDDMQFLTVAFEKGRVSEEQYLEAVMAQFDKTAEKMQEVMDGMDEFAKSAAKNIQDTLADFLFDPFGNGLDGMAEKFGKTIQRMVANIAAQKGGLWLFGDMGKTGEVGGIAGSALGWLKDILPSFDVGTDYVPHDMVAQIHKGERIVPAAQNKPGMQGGNVHVTQNFYGPAVPATVKRASASGYRAIRAEMAQAGRY